MHPLYAGVMFFLERRDAGVWLCAVSLKDEQTSWNNGARTSYPEVCESASTGSKRLTLYGRAVESRPWLGFRFFECGHGQVLCCGVFGKRHSAISMALPMIVQWGSGRFTCAPHIRIAGIARISIGRPQASWLRGWKCS